MASSSDDGSNAKTGRVLMSDAPEDGEQRAVADVLLDHYDEINLIETMRVGVTEYVALSGRNDSLTAHRVDVVEFTCTCGDQTYNRQDGEICGHLARCILDHSRLDESERVVSGEIKDAVDELRDAADEIRNTAQVERRTTEADEVREKNGNDQESEPSSSSSPTELVNDWLNSHQLNPNDFLVTEDEGAGEITIETNSVPEKDYQFFKQKATESDIVQWDRQEYHNYVNLSDIEGLSQ